jgi:hypothetical protein
MLSRPHSDHSYSQVDVETIVDEDPKIQSALREYFGSASDEKEQYENSYNNISKKYGIPITTLRR